MPDDSCSLEVAVLEAPGHDQGDARRRGLYTTACQVCSSTPSMVSDGGPGATGSLLPSRRRMCTATRCDRGQTTDGHRVLACCLSEGHPNDCFKLLLQNALPPHMLAPWDCWQLGSFHAALPMGLEDTSMQGNLSQG